MTNLVVHFLHMLKYRLIQWFSYLLSMAPPWSQSHGLQPSLSLDRPQCCGCREKSKRSNRQPREKRRRLTPLHWSAPGTGRSCVPRPSVCSSSFLFLDRRSFLLAACPAGCKYKLPRTHKKAVNPIIMYETKPANEVITLLIEML